MSMTGVECKKGGAAFTEKFAGAEYSTKIDQFRRQWSELIGAGILSVGASLLAIQAARSI
jgi:hypothetical protein